MTSSKYIFVLLSCLLLICFQNCGQNFNSLTAASNPSSNQDLSDSDAPVTPTPVTPTPPTADDPIPTDAITVTNVAQLNSEIDKANSSGGGQTLVLENGTYNLTEVLIVSAPNITVRSKSKQRSSVILNAGGVTTTAGYNFSNARTHVFNVSAAGFKIFDLTLQGASEHLVQIHGENNADGVHIKNVVFRDAYQQLLKGSAAADSNGLATGATTDNGIIENSLFEYTLATGPNWYIGGIDIHGGKNWVVRNNTFKNVVSPGSAIAEFAIHFWNRSEGNRIENNLIINCDRGIGFGLANRPNTGGIIRNNMIYHPNNNNLYSDVGIYIEDSPLTQIYNNTIFFQNAYPNAIEYRYAATSNVLIANNLTNKAIASREGASGTVANNFLNAQANMFVDASSANLHLLGNIAGVVDAGQNITGLTQDFDGAARINAPDIGANEYAAAK